MNFNLLLSKSSQSTLIDKGRARAPKGFHENLELRSHFGIIRSPYIFVRKGQNFLRQLMQIYSPKHSRVGGGGRERVEPVRVVHDGPRAIERRGRHVGGRADPLMQVVEAG